MKIYKKIFIFLFFHIILNNSTKTSSTVKENDFDSSSEHEQEQNMHTVATLIILLICLIVLVVILFIFYKFFLNSYIEKNKIPNFNTLTKKELKKHYLFQKLMKWNYYKKNEKNEEEVCPICLQKFNVNISKICVTPCKHIFHFYCLKKFVFEFNNFNCPYCKKDYLTNKKFNLQDIRIIPLNEEDNPINELKKIKFEEKNEKPLESLEGLNNDEPKERNDNINNNE
jgi:hypothetical protein